MSLARLWRDQGKVQQARELPVCGWLTEGFDTSRSEGGGGAARRVGAVTTIGSIRLRHEPILQDQRHRVNTLALRDHSVFNGTFLLRFTQHAGTSLGGVPCGVQN